MAITFSTPAQQYIHERVRLALEAIEVTFSADEDVARFYVRNHSAFCIIQIYPTSNGANAIVTTNAWVVRGANVSDPELRRFLLNANYDLNVGAFGIDGDGDICLSHSFFGTSLSTTQLQAQLHQSLISVAFTADKYDDIIVERWGGTRQFEPEAASEEATTSEETTAEEAG